MYVLISNIIFLGFINLAVCTLLLRILENIKDINDADIKINLSLEQLTNINVKLYNKVNNYNISNYDTTTT